MMPNIAAGFRRATDGMRLRHAKNKSTDTKLRYTRLASSPEKMPDELVDASLWRLSVYGVKPDAADVPVCWVDQLQ